MSVKQYIQVFWSEGDMLRLESWKGILGSENVFVTGVSEGCSLDIKECTCAWILLVLRGKGGASLVNWRGGCALCFGNFSVCTERNNCLAGNEKIHFGLWVF